MRKSSPSQRTDSNRPLVHSRRKMSTIGSAFNREFPTRNVLWPGCLLASIAHSVFVARAPFLAHEQSWVGRTYNIQDSEGSRGTIAFGGDNSLFVAVVYLLDSDRGSPVDRSTAENNIRTLLRDIPGALEGLVSEALQFILEGIGGIPMPVITAAFWSDLSSSQVTACESWPDVVKHGAIMFRERFASPDIALTMWATAYGFDNSEVTLTRAVFGRRLSTAGPVLLTADEARQVNQKSAGTEGLQACRESFGEIGIILP